MRAPARNVSAAVARPRQPLHKPARANVSADAVPSAPVAIEAPPINKQLAQSLESHPSLVRGTLNNGFEYVILPNKSPPGRFEAHLQMHVGSVDEHEHEQGIAHFVEHITFLGSHKRETVGSLGGRSNAYTDFQHTIFHVDSPTKDAMSGKPLVGVVVEMLAEVRHHRLLALKLAVTCHGHRPYR